MLAHDSHVLHGWLSLEADCDPAIVAEEGEVHRVQFVSLSERIPSLSGNTGFFERSPQTLLVCSPTPEIIDLLCCEQALQRRWNEGHSPQAPTGDPARQATQLPDLDLAVWIGCSWMFGLIRQQTQSWHHTIVSDRSVVVDSPSFLIEDLGLVEG
jgi:hypothetical protein